MKSENWRHLRTAKFARSDGEGEGGDLGTGENEKRAAEVPRRDIGRNKAAMFL